jgi:beta-glucuronidase
VIRTLFALVLAASSCFAQSPSASIDQPSRNTISLDGTWNTIVDPYETGLSSHYYETEKPKSKSDLIEFDYDHSPKLKVPGDWNTQRDSLLFYEGPVWYQRNFLYQRKEHRRVFLYFGAANYFSRVWLNGTKLGEHAGGFTPFHFEVTDQLVDGENSVVVEVDNTRRLEGVPSLKTDWWNYGGLTRGVKLIEVPEVFIENYAIQLAKNSIDVIDGWVQLRGAVGPVRVSVEIPEIHLKQTAQSDSSGRAALHVSPKLQLWSPENPKLYKVVITAGSDSITEEIGFRTIEARGTQILLNGKPIFLRGISMHEEAPFRSGRAFSEEDDRTLLTWAKELGCNFVRLAHYPHNEDMVRLADRMGLLVWEEVPVYWDIQWKNAATLELAKSQLHDVILRDQNRASVVFWSMSNETPISPERTDFLKALAGYARQLDDTRLITSALNRTEKTGPSSRKLADPSGQFMDVLGINEYIGWYEGKSEDADNTRWAFAYEKPVIISEFGADALYNLHGDAQTRFTEEYQANLFEHQLKMLSQMPQLAGMSPWVLMDFRSPRRPLPGIQDYFNRKGLVSARGQRKQAFYVLQKFYQRSSEETHRQASYPRINADEHGSKFIILPASAFRNFE